MRNNQLKPILIILIALLAVVLVVLTIVALSGLSNNGQAPTEPEKTTESSKTTEPSNTTGAADRPPLEIEGDEVAFATPYGKLYLPGKWAEELRICVDKSDGYDVIFYGVFGQHDEIPLFAVNFGGNQGSVVHTVFTENDVPVSVGIRTFPLETEGWSAVDHSTALAMQEDLNHLLTRLRNE